MVSEWSDLDEPAAVDAHLNVLFSLHFFGRQRLLNIDMRSSPRIDSRFLPKANLGSGATD